MMNISRDENFPDVRVRIRNWPLKRPKQNLVNFWANQGYSEKLIVIFRWVKKSLNILGTNTQNENKKN